MVLWSGWRKNALSVVCHVPLSVSAAERCWSSAWSCWVRAARQTAAGRAVAMWEIRWSFCARLLGVHSQSLGERVRCPKRVQRRREVALGLTEHSPISSFRGWPSGHNLGNLTGCCFAVQQKTMLMDAWLKNKLAQNNMIFGHR
eukprot:2998799-Rhodomonas_salina.4